jgi:tetratricopeptide (TPR) repeat protein
MKERYLDQSSSLPSEETTTTNPPLTANDALIGVLKMELLLRGVLVEDENKIYKQIQSSIGKTLLVDDSSLKIPKPLLAGANIMAGRIIEAFYNQLKTEINSSSLPKHLIPSEENLGAIRRAKEIEDERWLVLLQRIPSPPSIDKNNSNTEIGDINNIDSYFNAILQIALGYYTTAALIQSDTPPMWKKIWDVWTLLEKVAASSSSHENNNNNNTQSSPYESQIAIENLIRIALLKQNTKRASELQLRLIQSYLNQNRIPLSTASCNDYKSRATITQSFGDSITQDLPPFDKKDNKRYNADKARSTLIACQFYYEEETTKQEKEESTTLPTAIDSETMLYQTLQVEILVAEEDADDEAQEIEVSNQFIERVTILRDTLIATWKLTFNNNLNSNNNNNKDEEEERKSSIESDNDGEIKNLQLSFYWVYQSILRLKNKAGITSQKTRSYHKSWNVLLQYIIPILNEIEQQIADIEKLTCVDEDIISSNETRVQASIEWLNRTLGNDGSKNAKMKLIETAVSILPDVFWMLIGDGDGNIIIDPLDKELKLVADILSGLIQWQEKVESERLQREKIALTVGTQKSSVTKITLRWQHAKESALCFVCQDDNASIYQITNDAISRCKKKQKKGFLLFIQCLVSWSGFYQHPWPYCTNLSDARRLLAAAKSDLGRPLTVSEETLLQLAIADAELLNGGFVQNASKQYSGVLGKFQQDDDELLVNAYSVSLLRAHCYNGLARIHQADQEEEYADSDSINGSQTKKSLEILEDLDVPPVAHPLSIWNSQSIFEASKAHELSVARQLIADSLIRFGRFEEALSFLKTAVADSPLDADAAMALGAFLLRVAFYVHKERNKTRDKEAQIHLLKAAKLDSSKPNPFALLGIWYEEMGDSKRAQGCYVKSLKLDPCNPIAGRGLLRLASSKEDHLGLLQVTIDKNSLLNGWAWYAVGLNRAYNDGDDDLAVVAILKALRCRDVSIPDKEMLGIFYKPPSLSNEVNERSAALTDLGMCYRRLGRFTASIRAFHASIDAAGVDSVQSATLISCAQVEQELGCFDEAAKKFASVILRNDTRLSVALYGQAVALFSTAKRDLMDGKAGAAFCSIKHGIENCLNSSIKSGCELKLLGDLYSSGASFPFKVFCDDDNPIQDMEYCFQKQLEFVSRGEEAFRLSRTSFGDEKDTIAIKSSILCDIALNILLQAQLMSSIQIDSDNSSRSQDVITRYDRASEAFRQAIEYNPIHAASWCGLGCSVLKKDPLLAQHAFSRCVQIESMSPDAYANVGFMYTSKLAINASRSTMEALTQVADTPMMWMNCAFILEREAERSLVEGEKYKPNDSISQAADAYRASLQVMRHPEAQLGLSLTGRMLHSNEETKQDMAFFNLCTLKRKDCYSFMNEYMDASFSANGAASVFQGVMSIEKGSSMPPYAMWQIDIFMKGKEMAGFVKGGENISSKSLHDASISKLAIAVETPIGVNEKKKCASDATNLQRQIWKQPDRADLWLSLAKVFIENGAIESARTAVSRAACMLSQELMSSSRINSRTLSFVDSKTISEAISLEYWLKEIQTKKPGSTCRLQRALMMNPGNAVARKGLLLAEAKTE